MNGAVFERCPIPSPSRIYATAASARPSAITTALWRIRLLISERCCSAPVAWGRQAQPKQQTGHRQLSSSASLMANRRFEGGSPMLVEGLVLSEGQNGWPRTSSRHSPRDGV